MSGWTKEQVLPTTPNSPKHDLLVGDTRLSIKSETGKRTRESRIRITKLCTTEAGVWSAEALVSHAITHISRHDKMLMLRAIWKPKAIEYQLLDIPLQVLRRMKGAEFREVGKRPGRRSFGAEVIEGDKRIFRVHFDGADGKCQVQDLLVSSCRMLRQWQQPLEP
jgi:hypothetical protein